jgi:hypothetical protein
MAKQHNLQREYHLICTKCNVLWRDCTCPYSDENKVRLVLTEAELNEYFKTGLVPDIEAELWKYEGAPPPPLIKAGESTKKMEYLRMLLAIVPPPHKRKN